MPILGPAKMLGLFVPAHHYPRSYLLSQLAAVLLGGLVDAGLETDLALPVTAGKTTPVGVAVEVDAAQVLGGRKTRVAGTAAETELALAVTYQPPDMPARYRIRTGQTAVMWAANVRR